MVYVGAHLIHGLNNAIESEDAGSIPAGVIGPSQSRRSPLGQGVLLLTQGHYFSLAYLYFSFIVTSPGLILSNVGIEEQIF
jgi:hypothetical protein